MAGSAKNSVRDINDNAKMKLLTELIINGNSLKKVIKPLIPYATIESLSSEKNATILNSIINDKTCMSGTAKSIANSIIVSKRKQTKKDFIIQANLNNIIKFVTPDSINKWQILNVPNNPHGRGFDSLKQSINNLSLQNTTNVKEDIDITPIQRIDNTPAFYKGRSGD
jgi:hypothetical protein